MLEIMPMTDKDMEREGILTEPQMTVLSNADSERREMPVGGKGGRNGTCLILGHGKRMDALTMKSNELSE
jgi:hypothetical protein